VSAPGSRLATEYHPDGGSGIAERASAMSAQWSRHGLDLNLGELFYTGERRSVVEYLEQLGWRVSVRSRPEMFAACGRAYPEGETTAGLRTSLSVTAIKE
jgi:O-methyltransferase involved in polyketide biosynthesis